MPKIEEHQMTDAEKAAWRNIKHDNRPAADRATSTTFRELVQQQEQKARDRANEGGREREL